jgi:diacylglycerol kinase family enzyme
MNKIISIVLILAMLASVCVSCGKPDEDGESNKVEETKVEICDECGIEIDGEAVGKSPFTFEMVPQAIRVVVGVNYHL